MKFYETHFDDYLSSIGKFNLHPELEELYSVMPGCIKDFKNLIVYGPSGSGKYSQVLRFIKRYSPSELKYDRKITASTDKQQYTYHISDIHYEIDMSFMGCNSKTLWHEIFLQIVDIISIAPDKNGIIICKNFHMIHSELLEVFYSYIQHYNNPYMNIQIKFILVSEHISFLPSNIINVCKKVNICKPEKMIYNELIESSTMKEQNHENITLLEKFTEYKKNHKKDNMKNLISKIETNTIMNIKEIRSFSLIKNVEDIPSDIFNIICNNIINEIDTHDSLDFSKFRDTIYDILIYNLDAAECFWYIFFHFINNGRIEKDDISDILQKTYTFLKYYNNNYRPIYHLESIMFTLINKINKYI